MSIIFAAVDGLTSFSVMGSNLPVLRQMASDKIYRYLHILATTFQQLNSKAPQVSSVG
jgi:hypothetical protein